MVPFPSFGTRQGPPVSPPALSARFHRAPEEKSMDPGELSTKIAGNEMNKVLTSVAAIFMYSIDL